MLNNIAENTNRVTLCSMTEKLQFTRQTNGVTIITFNRPQVLNALNLDMMRAFSDYVDALKHDSQLRALILTGAGGAAFCSGGDLVELSQHPTEADARYFITLMGDALLQMERLPVPVIAAINGYALGGGSEIALACDLRIIDAGAKMGFVQINMALIPGWGAGQRLLRVVGYAKAIELLLTGHVLYADDLLALGVANQAVAKGRALQTALDLANQIAAHPPQVVQGVKTLLQAGLSTSYIEALQIERDIFPPLWAAESHLQAVERFLRRHQTKSISSDTEG